MLLPDERPFWVRVIDRAFLLYTIKKINEFDVIEGDTKLQKIVFTLETTMKEKRTRGFNYNIVKWDFGPFSKELAIDKDFLEKNGLVTEGTIKLTEEGERLVSLIKNNIEKDHDLQKAIGVITKTMCEKSLDKILGVVYSSKFKLPDGRETMIAAIPKGTPMIERSMMRDNQNKSVFDDAAIETLDVMMNKEMFSSLQKALMMPATKEFKF